MYNIQEDIPCARHATERLAGGGGAGSRVEEAGVAGRGEKAPRRLSWQLSVCAYPSTPRTHQRSIPRLSLLLLSSQRKGRRLSMAARQPLNEIRPFDHLISGRRNHPPHHPPQEDGACARHGCCTGSASEPAPAINPPISPAHTRTELVRRSNRHSSLH